jgi:hypothetical protein
MIFVLQRNPVSSAYQTSHPATPLNPSNPEHPLTFEFYKTPQASRGWAGGSKLFEAAPRDALSASTAVAPGGKNTTPRLPPRILLPRLPPGITRYPRNNPTRNPTLGRPLADPAEGRNPTRCP